MNDINERSITEAVLASMSKTSNARLKAIMTSLVSHLHDFAREIRLSEEEWFTAIKFLTSVGQISDDRRQEFVLLSDTLGLSMLVTSQNNHKPTGCTEATVLGPFYIAEPPAFHNGADIANGAIGTPCFVSGTVSGPNGQRISGALIDVWQSDEDGFYDVQRPAADGMLVPQARGRLETLSDGSFHFKSILAEAYPIPNDGPVGEMLSALGRHPWRPAHLHFWIRAEGYDPLITHIFRAGDKYVDSDAVFGVRSSLIVDWKHHDPGVTPDGSASQTPFYTVMYDFVLSESDIVFEPLSASATAAESTQRQSIVSGC